MNHRFQEAMGPLVAYESAFEEPAIEGPAIEELPEIQEPPAIQEPPEIEELPASLPANGELLAVEELAFEHIGYPTPSVALQCLPCLEWSAVVSKTT